MSRLECRRRFRGAGIRPAGRPLDLNRTLFDPKRAPVDSRRSAKYSFLRMRQTFVAHATKIMSEIVPIRAWLSAKAAAAPESRQGGAQAEHQPDIKGSFAKNR